MCFLKPLRIKKIKGKKILLENGLLAYYDKNIGRLKDDDLVLVYGNLVIQKMDDNKNQS